MENLKSSLAEIEQVFETTLEMLNDVAAAATRLANSGDNIAKSSSETVDKAKEAIESARAGEQGKGFAVEAMRQVSTDVEKGVEVTERAKENLSEIMKMMEHTVSLMEGISNDVSDQSQGTGLISQNTLSVVSQGKKGMESVQQIAGAVSVYAHMQEKQTLDDKILKALCWQFGLTEIHLIDKNDVLQVGLDASKLSGFVSDFA